MDLASVKIDDIIIAVNNKPYRVLGFLIGKDTGDKEEAMVYCPDTGITLNDLVDMCSDYYTSSTKIAYLDKEVWAWPAHEILRKEDDDSLDIAPTAIVEYPDGLNCCICNEHNPYAEPNIDHGWYACYNCKTTRQYMIKQKQKEAGL